MRIRVRFAKHGKVRFTSHRDVARIWERALRRVGLPVAYSEGFSPRPKISFGLALSTGHESDAEYLDVELVSAPPMPFEELAAMLSGALPDGLAVDRIATVDRSGLSLQQAVTSCTWRIDVSDVDEPTVSSAVSRALESTEIVVTRERKGKQVVDDLRPQVLSLDVSGPTDNGVRLLAELGTQPRALRPSELLAALDPPLREWRVHRTHQWITTDDGPREPLEPSATSLVAAAGAS